MLKSGSDAGWSEPGEGRRSSDSGKLCVRLEVKEQCGEIGKRRMSSRRGPKYVAGDDGPSL